MPLLKDLAIGLWQRAWIFLRGGNNHLHRHRRAVGFADIPQAAPGESQVEASAAGQISKGLAVIVEPIGFNREIALALIQQWAAREVASAACDHLCGRCADEEAAAAGLASQLSSRWSLPTALAFLAWFVFAPQCLSTIAVTRRETNGWKWPAFMLAYLFGLAYIFAGLTFWLATAAGL